MYSEFESGMLSGTARVYEHQIPGGQVHGLGCVFHPLCYLYSLLHACVGIFSTAI